MSYAPFPGPDGALPTADHLIASDPVDTAATPRDWLAQLLEVGLSLLTPPATPAAKEDSQ